MLGNYLTQNKLFTTIKSKWSCRRASSDNLDVSLRGDWYNGEKKLNENFPRQKRRLLLLPMNFSKRSPRFPHICNSSSGTFWEPLSNLAHHSRCVQLGSFNDSGIWRLDKLHKDDQQQNNISSRKTVEWLVDELNYPITKLNSATMAAQCQR